MILKGWDKKFMDLARHISTWSKDRSTKVGSIIVDKNNIVHSREITIASEMPDLYVIGAGLNQNERILLEGIRKVKDADKITYEYEDPKTVLPKLKIYVE